MPEKMIKAFREPDALSACVKAFENRLNRRRYFFKSSRQDDETALRFLKELYEIKNAPEIKSLSGDDMILAQYDIIRIVFDEKTVTVFNTEYGNRRDFIYTLDDCLQKVMEMMLPRKVNEESLHFIVIANNPLKGIVLEYGNHGPRFEQVGVTCGYA